MSNSVILLGISDPHWADKKPRSRKDDFKATQRRKISDVLKLATSLKWEGVVRPTQGVVIAGDLFHQKKGRLISRRLDTELMELFLEFDHVPKFAIAGNHDMEHDRIDSLKDHPLGALAAAGLVDIVHWPEYSVVKTDEVNVIVTGVAFARNQPKIVLDSWRETKLLIDLKQEITEKTGNLTQALVMTHNHWGPKDGVLHSEPILGHQQAANTGIDVVLYGHPHTYDGCHTISDGHGEVTVVGPGALIRGTLAEHDTQRIPRIALMVFNPDGSHKVSAVPIPCEPADQVFDLVKHERQKKEKKAQEKFIDELKKTTAATKSPEEVLKTIEAEDQTTPQVLELVKSFLIQAEAEVK